MAHIKKISIWVINSFIAITIIALVFTAYLTFAKATITIPGSREDFKATTVIDVIPDKKDQSITGDVMSKDFAVSDTFSVGSKTSKSDKAGGVATITNQTAKDQALVKTTRLMTPDGKIFRITSAVTVPAGKSIDVFAEADSTDPSYLIGPSKFIIPGLWEGLQDKIFAETKAAMSLDRMQSAAVTQDDLTKAEEALKAKTLETALEEFKKNATSTLALTSDMLALNKVSLDSSTPIGSEATSITVTLKSKVAALFVSPDDVYTATQKKLLEELPDPEALIEIQPSSLKYSIAAISSETKTAQLNAELTAWVRSNAQIKQIDKKQLTGKNITDAQAYLKSQGIEDATITLAPSWLPGLPMLEDHITVEVK